MVLGEAVRPGGLRGADPGPEDPHRRVEPERRGERCHGDVSQARPDHTTPDLQRVDEWKRVTFLPMTLLVTRCRICASLFQREAKRSGERHPEGARPNLLPVRL